MTDRIECFNLSRKVYMEKLILSQSWFQEINRGRKVLLRGINLGGDTKVPFPNGGTQFPDDFSNHADVSFVGRPFTLDHAEEHLDRIKNWGFNALRLLTTWEAVEHKGPGIYDTEYLEYFKKITELAAKKGFYMFIDFHQDVWSRMTGGDGAPGWTLEKVGIDISKISSSDSSLVMQRKYDYSKPNIRQEENYPTMCWAQNYRYPANAIMWTLFFAGKIFASKFFIHGQNVQDYLQSHYLNSMKQIAEKVQHIDEVIGFDSLNEPSRGWIGTKLNYRGLHPNGKSSDLPGLAWSPIDALFTSNGYSIELPFMELSLLHGGFYKKKDKIINPNRICLWKDETLGDPFRAEGAWELKDDMPFILNNDFFTKSEGKDVNFDDDFMIPFVHSVSQNIQSIREDWIVFAEKEATGPGNSQRFNKPLPKKTVNASHWYDLTTLVFKRFNYPITLDAFKKKLVFGRSGIQKMYISQMKNIKEASDKHNIPTLLGEFGIPFDLHSGKAYSKWKQGSRDPKIWKHHILALDLMYNAIDNLGLHSTLWNYTAGNKNNLMIGDQWNQEDLSIFSLDQIDKSFPDLAQNPFGYGSGGRAIEGFSRPYPMFIAGDKIEFSFESRSKTFFLKYEAEESKLGEESEIFVPKIHFPNGCKVIAIQGQFESLWEEPILKIIAKQKGIIQIKIS
jgi:hypothetical protein